MDKIISSITNILNIDDEILTKFLGYLHPMTVPKKTILIRPLITDENVYIIEKGIARSYIMINEKEVTSWFSKEGELIFSTNSFYGKTEGYENERVQILEDSLLYYIKISDLEELCFQHIEISNAASKGICGNGKEAYISFIYVCRRTLQRFLCQKP